MRFGDAHLYLNHLEQAFQDSRKSKPKFLARNTESLETRRESLETRRESLETRRVSEGNHQETQTSLLTRRVTIHLRASPRSGFKTIAPRFLSWTRQRVLRHERHRRDSLSRPLALTWVSKLLLNRIFLAFHLKLILIEYRSNLFKEIVDVSELAVDAGETNVSNVVDLDQLFHDHLSDLLAIDL